MTQAPNRLEIELLPVFAPRQVDFTCPARRP